MTATKIPSLRVNVLLKKLEKFGLTHRQGKGSEVVVTGHLFGHDKNTNTFRRYRLGTHGPISGHTIEAILRRFKIKREDFLAIEH